MTSREQEERLTAASQRLQARVDAFRTQKGAFKATYTAAEVSRSRRGVPEPPGHLLYCDDEVEVSGEPSPDASGIID